VGAPAAPSRIHTPRKVGLHKRYGGSLAAAPALPASPLAGQRRALDQRFQATAEHGNTAPEIGEPSLLAVLASRVIIRNLRTSWAPAFAGV